LYSFCNVCKAHYCYSDGLFFVIISVGIIGVMKEMKYTDQNEMEK